MVGLSTLPMRLICWLQDRSNNERWLQAVEYLALAITDDEGNPSDFLETITIAAVILAASLFIVYRCATLD